MILLALVALCACSRATSAPMEVSPGQTARLDAGQSVSVAGSAVSATFVSATDSRCPSDVVCISAGEARVVVRLQGAGDPRTDTLLLVKPNQVRYGSYVFEATELRPFPVSQGQQANKVLTLRVTGAP